MLEWLEPKQTGAISALLEPVILGDVLECCGCAFCWFRLVLAVCAAHPEF